MAGQTDILESSVLNYIWRGDAMTFTGPGKVALGTSATTPQEDGTGFTEQAGPKATTGYEQQSLSSSVATASTEGAIGNDLLNIEFGPVVGSAWAIKYVAIMDNTGVSVLAWQDLNPSGGDITVNAGQKLVFTKGSSGTPGTGSLSHTLD